MATSIDMPEEECSWCNTSTSTLARTPEGDDLCPLCLEKHLCSREKELEDVIFNTQNATPRKNSHKSIVIYTSEYGKQRNFVDLGNGKLAEKKNSNKPKKNLSKMRTVRGKKKTNSSDSPNNLLAISKNDAPRTTGK